MGLGQVRLEATVVMIRDIQAMKGYECPDCTSCIIHHLFGMEDWTFIFLVSDDPQISQIDVYWIHVWYP